MVIIMNWLHIMAAIVLVGGMVFTHFVLTPPAVEKAIPPSFIRIMGIERFRRFAWGSLVILFVTGLYRIKGFSLGMLTGSPYGNWLLLKIGLSVLLLVNTVFVSGVLAPSITRLAGKMGPRTTDSPQLLKKQALLVLFGKANLLLAIMVVFIAVLVKYIG